MVSRNTITVRAMPPISSDARVAGILRRVSPLASCFIAPARPLSGRVMLRPISQLKPRPISTAAQPTQMMMFVVRDCEAVNAAEAAAAFWRAEAMMSSVIGIMLRRSRSIEVMSAPDGVGALDPFGERIGVGLHLLAQTLLHDFGGDDPPASRLKVLSSSKNSACAKLVRVSR